MPTQEQLKDELIAALKDKIDSQDKMIELQKAVIGLKDQKIEAYKDFIATLKASI